MFAIACQAPHSQPSSSGTAARRTASLPVAYDRTIPHSRDVSDGIDKPRDCRQMRRVVHRIFNLHLNVPDWVSPKEGRVGPCLQMVAGHARVVYTRATDQ